MEADALNASFYLPDMLSYFLVGGAASITFVTIFTRYRETGREAEGQRSLSVILTTMYLVMGGAIVLAELMAPWFIHWLFPGFGALKAAFLPEESLARYCWCASNSACRRSRR
jgi:putative peptidoglycan lipid II flippase